MSNPVLELIDHAYRLDLEERQWFAGLARYATPIVPSAAGAMAYAFDASDPQRGVPIRSWGAHNVPDRFVDATIRLNEMSAPEDAARFYHHGVLCGTVSERLAIDGENIDSHETYTTSVGNHGFSDTFGLTASSPTMKGVVINSPLAVPTTLHRKVKDLWRRIGVHVQAAYRLRQAIGAGDSEPEAIIDSDGSIANAEGAAREATHQERLRQAVYALDAQRAGDMTRDPATALMLWQGLVDGRWSLVEQFERDGRRYFLDYPNEFDLSNPRALSRRERAVVAYVVQGDSNKWIGYQLGISDGTVARHLATALRKLGLKHRNELIWMFQSIRRFQS
jgi:DNA-binding CsgD family transcriptional regulator